MSSGKLFISFFLIIFLISFSKGEAQVYQWAKQGVSEGYDYGNSLITDDSGNVYIAGQIEYTAVFDGVSLVGAGQHDIVVGKYNTNGTMKWIKRAGGKTGDVGWGVGIDKFHNVYMAGEFESTAVFGPDDSITASGPNDAVLAKYGPDGDIIWIKRMGGGNDDKARAIAVDQNGNSYVTGFFTSTGSFGGINVTSSGGNDVFIAKYNSAGTCKWVKKAGGSREDRGRGIALDKFGNVYVVGTFTQSINFNGTNFSSQGSNSAFIAKYDTSGNYKWAKVAGACCDTSRYVAVTCDDAGNIYTTGYFQNEMTVGTTNMSAKGVTDVVISKYSSAGNVLWTRNDGGINEDAAYGIHYDNNKDLLYVTGFYDYQADFDSIHVNSVGNRDAFLAAYNSSGKIQWLRSAGGNGRDGGLAVDCDTLGNVYQSGYFNYYADFDSHHLTGDTLPDFFLVKSSPALEPQPSNGPSSAVASIANCNDVQLNWSPGNGSGRIVVVRSAQSPNVFPSDGTTYNSNSVFGIGTNIGNGNFVVYKGTGNSVLITGLTQGTQYVFTVIEYNGSTATINYNTSLFATTTSVVNGFSMNLSAASPSICSGSQTTLSASGGVTYQWSPSYALSSTNGSSVSASPAVSTTYTVNGTNSNGCHSTEHIIVYVNSLPAVNYSNPIQVCINASPVALNGGSPSGGNYSGTSVSNGIFNPVIAGAGSHAVSYTYTDANGCTSSATSSILVNPLPVITMPAFPGLCENSQPLTLAGALPSGGQYAGNAVSSGVFDPVTAGQGTSNITYTYSDNNGCENSGSANIIVHTLPAVSISSLPDVCANSQLITLTAGIPAGGIYSGQGVSSNIFSPITAGTGNHLITYQYTDNNGCMNSSTTSIYVKELPTVFFASLLPLCADHLPINLSGGIPSGGSYSGTGVSNNMFDPLVTGTGNFNLTYTFLDSSGCENSASQTIKVNSLPATSLVVPADVCRNGSSITLAGGYPAGGIYSGQNVINGVFNTSAASVGPNDIIYTYTDNNNCTGATTRIINVRNLPEVNLGSDSVVCTGASIIIDAGPGFSSYHWSNGANTQSIQVSNNIASTITCMVTVTNSYNCSGTDTLRIIFDNCSGIASINSEYPWCYIYPNPFKNDFTIFSEKKLSVKIYDVSGRMIEEHECTGSMVAGQNLSSGVYFIDAIFNGQRKTYKVIKAE